jgi:hypothetical protein
LSHSLSQSSGSWASRGRRSIDARVRLLAWLTMCPSAKPSGDARDALGSSVSRWHRGNLQRAAAPVHREVAQDLGPGTDRPEASLLDEHELARLERALTVVNRGGPASFEHDKQHVQLVIGVFGLRSSLAILHSGPSPAVVRYMHLLAIGFFVGGQIFLAAVVVPTSRAGSASAPWSPWPSW